MGPCSKRKNLPATFGLLFIISFNPLGANAQLTAKRLLVVYNESFPGSQELAEEYAKERGVPERLVVGITAPSEEVITRQIYIDSIREPIDTHLRRLGLVDRAQTRTEILGVTRNLIVTTRCDIYGILLSYGFPVTISHDPSVLDETQPQQMHNSGAAVDSELATMLTLGLNPTGLLANPFFKSETRFQHPQPVNALLILLVTRLDGPSLEMARQRLRESWQVEKAGGLNGLGLFDSRGLTEGGLKVGDEWIEQSARLYRNAGFRARVDTFPEQFSETANFRNVTFYLGWYSEHPQGIFLNPNFTFSPGAVAYHLHSFSAHTIRSETNYWVGPLIVKGASATFGNVLEPYLGFTPHLDVFTERILRGWTFAEAVYASIPGLSWMLTAVGDPLYTPFPSAAKNKQTALDRNEKEKKRSQDQDTVPSTGKSKNKAVGSKK